MLGKLLKYDFKNLYKTLLPIYSITIIITILTVILNKLSNTSNLFSTLNGLMILSYVVILMVLVVGTFFLSIRDFYLDFASERGYLINTLPVKKSTIITSKFITGVVTMTSSLVVMFISILILIIGNGEWTSFANSVANLIRDIPTDGVVMLILMTVLMIVAYISGLAVCYLSIALGQLKNTNIDVAKIDTIYLGGGTPNCLDSDQLELLLQLLRPYSLNVQEYTIEINAEAMDESKYQLLKRYKTE